MSSGITSSNLKICNWRVQRKKKREVRDGAKKLIEEIMAEIFPDFIKIIKPIDPSSMNPNTSNKKETLPRHIIIKLFKTSDKVKIS